VECEKLLFHWKIVIMSSRFHYILTILLHYKHLYYIINVIPITLMCSYYMLQNVTKMLHALIDVTKNAVLLS